MGPSRSQKHDPLLLKWFPIIQWLIGALICIVVSTVMWTVWVVQNVPKISYVDDHFKKAMDYTDIKIAELGKMMEIQGKQITEESHQWSNNNKSLMQAEFNKEYASLAAKQDMMIDELRVLRQSQAYEQGRRISR